MRVINPKSGQFAATKSTIYQGKANAHAHLDKMHIFNEGAGSNTVAIHVCRSGSTSRQVYSRVMTSGEKVTIGDMAIFNEDDLLEASASNAGEVSYDLTVREESPL